MKADSEKAEMSLCRGGMRAVFRQDPRRQFETVVHEELGRTRDESSVRFVVLGLPSARMSF